MHDARGGVASSRVGLRYRAHDAHLDPNLAYVGPAFLARKETIMEFALRGVEVTRLCPIKGQLVYQRNGHGSAIGIFLKRGYMLCRGSLHVGQRIIQA